ncbi:hypothetical protein AX15_005898 [Amanita polypyramis BW_CC]|nr:hypothetical protein AX15_005898 [Amanita polypyramis BW_CC]
MNNPPPSSSDFPPPTSNGHTPIMPTEDTEMEIDGPRNNRGESTPEHIEVSDELSDSGSVQTVPEALEIMMGATEDNRQDTGTSYRQSATPAPSSTPSRPAALRNNNRRARVEDDEDEERDRRHPTQRINDRSSDSSSTSQTPLSSPSPSQSPPPVLSHTARIRTAFNLPSLARIGIDQRDPFRFFQHLMPQPQAQQNIPRRSTNDTAMTNNNNPGAAQQTSQSANENTTPSTHPAPQMQNPQPHGNESDGEPQSDFAMFAEMLMRVGLLGAAFGGLGVEPEADDPERAKKLVNGLEEVPIGLVRRLERVGGTDDEEAGRDTMCAICWDQLLDDAGFGGNDSKKESPDSTNVQESTSSNSSASSSLHHPPPKDEPVEHQRAKIVSLPCAHVFHADCLVPWFSRPKQTTCPTCRFNIDPENLTRSQGRRSMPRMAAQPPTEPTPNDDQQRHAAANAHNAGHSVPDQGVNDNTNRPTGQFGFDQLRIPIIISGQPLFPFGFAGPGNNTGGQGDGTPNHEIMDQLRASVEEQLRTRAGQGPQQVPSGSNAESNNNTAPSVNHDPSLPPLLPWPPQPAASSVPIPVNDAPNSPSTQTETPAQPRPSQSNPRTRPEGGHGVTHSIVFGFDVLVGNPMFGARPDGHTMDVDDAPGNDRNWMGMMMQDILGGRGEASTPGSNANPNPPRHANDTSNTGEGTAGTGEAQNRGNMGFPRFFNMNLVNGESFHIASGAGRTMGEAMSQLLNSMGMPPQAEAPTNGNGDVDRNMEANANTDVNVNATRESDRPSQDRPSGLNQNHGQEDEERNGGTPPGMGSLSMQILSHMLGFGSPAHARRRQSQDENHPSETTGQPQTESTPPDVNHPQPPEEGGAPPPTPGTNFIDGGAFARFLRGLAGNAPTGATEQEDNHMYFFSPGTEPPAGTAPASMPQSEKKQWAPPAAPGPTLRQRIEKREREAGLRCHDVSCGVGPSDEDPIIFVTTDGIKQLTLRPVNVDGTTSTQEGARTCVHTFHPSCLRCHVQCVEVWEGYRGKNGRRAYSNCRELPLPVWLLLAHRLSYMLNENSKTLKTCKIEAILSLYCMAYERSFRLSLIFPFDAFYIYHCIVHSNHIGLYTVYKSDNRTLVPL